MDPKSVRSRRPPQRPDPGPVDRDAIAIELLHYGDKAGYDWADIVDALTMYPDQRRRVVRLLGELEAQDPS